MNLFLVPPRCALIFFLFLFGIGAAHPQCRTFLPPFPVDDNTGGPCATGRIPGEREELTCCTRAEQDTLRLAAAAHDASPACTDVLAEVACATCHPFSEHIFGTPGERLPSLCPDYCLALAVACAGEELTIAGVTIQAPASDADTAARHTFCAGFLGSDSGYCLPALEALEAEAEPEEVGDGDGSERICLQPVAEGWQNAIAVVAPPDGSDRLMVVEQIGIVWALQMPEGHQARTVFMDISDRIFLRQVGAGDERGMWWIEFHPQVRSFKAKHTKASGRWSCYSFSSGDHRRKEL